MYPTFQAYNLFSFAENSSAYCVEKTLLLLHFYPYFMDPFDSPYVSHFVSELHTQRWQKKSAVCFFLTAVRARVVRLSSTALTLCFEDPFQKISGRATCKTRYLFSHVIFWRRHNSPNFQYLKCMFGVQYLT